MASFDLTCNPFYILRVSPRDDRSAITHAYEAALAEAGTDEHTLLAAQRMLMTPKSRLEAEISWFLDVAPTRVHAIMSSLTKWTEGTSLQNLLEEVEGLARVNLAAHLCANGHGSSSTLQAVIAGQNECLELAILESVNANRSVAKFPRADRNLVSQALRSLREKYRDATFEGIVSAKHPGKVMTELVEMFLESEGPAGDFLEDVAEKYDAWSMPRLRSISDKIDAAAEHVRSGATNESAVQVIVDNLVAWDEYNLPLQLINGAKGLDEPKSRRVYKSLRNLYVWLANEEGQYSLALKISKALLDTFPELPSVTDAAEDIDTLKELIEEAKQEKVKEALDGLVAVAESAMGSMYKLLDSVLDGDFASGKQGMAGQLYQEFSNAVQRTEGSEHAELPWSILRRLAIELNNECERADASLMIMEALVNYRDAAVPRDILRVLQKDLKVIKGNLVWEDVEADLRVGQLKQALKRLDGLLSVVNNADEKAKILSFRSGIQEKLHNKRRNWVIAGCIVVAVAAFIMMDLRDSTKEKSSVGKAPSAVHTTPVRAKTPTQYPAARLLAQNKPPAGTENRLSRSEIRYCLFQEERIEAISAMALTKYEVTRFNQLVGDYNARCVKYRYRPDDLSAVQSELITARPRLRKEAQELVQSWRRESGFVLLDPRKPTDAMKIQRRLKELGYYNGVVDGIWGPGSQAALRTIRGHHGLSNTDTWDVETQIGLFGNTVY